MRHTKSARRLAVHRGVPIEFDDGSTFNSSGARADAFVDEEPPPAPPSLKMEDVERLLAARDVVWRAELERVAGQRKDQIRSWRFNVLYTKDGRVGEIAATAD